jgi:hypothetical protein
MAAEEFNPFDHARPPREEGWEEETEKIIEHIKNRGDQRIGQLIVNAVSKEIEFEPPAHLDKDVQDLTDEEVEEHMDKIRNYRNEYKSRIEQKIWNIEADELAELLQELQKEIEEQ